MKYTYKHAFGAYWSFTAMEYYLGMLNRTYQIFVTPTIIAGAFVTSIMAAPLVLPRYWFVPTNYVNKKRIQKYESISAESDEFMRFSPFFNFQYARAEIHELEYDPTLKWGMGTVAHSGKLYIELDRGRKREFILLGLQQGKEILHHLQPEPIIETLTNHQREIHSLLESAYSQPDNLDTWARLAELFSIQGEQAQAAYCRARLQNLRLLWNF
jgi:hypothetical protein